MNIVKDSAGRVIVDTTARFSALSNGLVRIEYNAKGIFEDRKSIRALYRPDAIAFCEQKIDQSSLLLSTTACTIRYIPDGRPFSGTNLMVTKKGEHTCLWRPGQVDTDNLGGVHFAMDVVNRKIIPKGVHPATTEYHENSGKWMLWNYCFGGFQVGASVQHMKGKNLEDILATTDFEELSPPMQELIAERQKFPPGLLSKSGYFLYNDSTVTLLDADSGNMISRKDSMAQDWYLFVYGYNFKAALGDYQLLFGKIPLLPKYVLGLWYSRYPTFNQDGLTELVEEFEKKDLPLDVLVLDLEWHQRGWHGFDWDTKHIPNPNALLDFLQKRDIHITLNAHPNALPVDDSGFERFIRESGITNWEKNVHNSHQSYPDQKALYSFDVGEPRYAKAYMDVFHKPVQDQGVDFWWIDGQAPVDAQHNIDEGYFTNHMYHEHIRNECPDRRPMIFSRTHGFGGHRYPFHFTGDAVSQWETLENQVEQTLRAGNMGQSYITHDIAGHFSYNAASMIDPELYLRWMQFAALSPMVRLHGGGGNERRPWVYGNDTLAAFKKIMELRMELVPYLYTIAYQSTLDCVPMCRANYIERPEWLSGYDDWSSYFLGDRIYAAPVTTQTTVREVLLPPGGWYSGLTGEYVESNGTHPIKAYSPLANAPLHFYKAGTIMVKQPYSHKASSIPEKLILEVYSSHGLSEDVFTLYEDDGLSRDHEKGSSALTEFRLSQKSNIEITIGATQGEYRGQPPSRSYEIRIFGYTGETMTARGMSLVGEAISGERSYMKFCVENVEKNQVVQLAI